MKLLWQIYKKLSIYSNYISYIFIIIYLFEFKNNFDFLLIFALLHALVSPIGHILGNIITVKITPKVSVLIANFLAILQTIIFIYYMDNLTMPIVMIIAVLAGVSSGIKEIADYIYEKTFEYYEDPIQIQMDETLLGGLIRLMIFLPSAFLITKTDNFANIFLLLILSIVINSIIILKLSPNYSIIQNSFKEIFRFPRNNPKINVLVNSTIIEGLFESINKTILPVTLLLFTGNILDWGLINFAVTVVTIIFGLIYFKKVNLKNYKIGFGLVTFLLATTSIFIVADFNITILIVYILFVGINETISSIGYRANYEQIVNIDPEKTSHLTEYKTYKEIILSLSKAIPLIVLLYYKPDFSIGIMTQVAIVTASLLPFLTFTIINKSYKSIDAKLNNPF